MYAKWTFPWSIVEEQSSLSYLVEMPDNSEKHLHVYKIIQNQTENIGVIYESEIDFGDIKNVPVIKRAPNDETYIKTHLNSSHLNNDQKQSINDLLMKNM
ncbi:hypothetical protein NPIL_495281 [Nephila pilipes]|uniref:Uncharacterized protein n=1 Tax=Nephila pilipes TaxID=299642 RepID=A0A8X6TVS6_NEPPI|nr:hypothetical protein NPIL_495281 [Nephila pilipes]